MNELEDVIQSMMVSGQQLMSEGQQNNDFQSLEKASRALAFASKLEKANRRAISNDMMLADLSSRNSRIAQQAKGGQIGSAIVSLDSLNTSYMPSNTRGGPALRDFFGENPEAAQLLQTAERYVSSIPPFQVDDGEGGTMTVTGSNLMQKARNDHRIAKEIYDKYTTEEDRGAFAEMLGYTTHNGELLSLEDGKMVASMKTTAIRNGFDPDAYADAMMTRNKIIADVMERNDITDPTQAERLIDFDDNAKVTKQLKIAQVMSDMGVDQEVATDFYEKTQAFNAQVFENQWALNKERMRLTGMKNAITTEAVLGETSGRPDLFIDHEPGEVFHFGMFSRAPIWEEAENNLKDIITSSEKKLAENEANEDAGSKLSSDVQIALRSDINTSRIAIGKLKHVRRQEVWILRDPAMAGRLGNDNRITHAVKNLFGFLPSEEDAGRAYAIVDDIVKAYVTGQTDVSKGTDEFTDAIIKASSFPREDLALYYANEIERLSDPNILLQEFGKGTTLSGMAKTRMAQEQIHNQMVMKRANIAKNTTDSEWTRQFLAQKGNEGKTADQALAAKERVILESVHLFQPPRKRSS